MKIFNLNIPVSIFLVGAILFLFAPIESFSAYSSQEISMAGLLIELAGILLGLIMFYRHKVTEMYLEDI